jgi:hypothetical protein
MRTSKPNSRRVLPGVIGKSLSLRKSRARTKHSLEVDRVVRWFEKDGDALVGERQLENLKLSTLQRLFRVSENNPMYDCYPIKTKLQIRYIQKAANHPIDLLAYDYFLECDDDATTLIASEGSTTLTTDRNGQSHPR